MGGVGTIARMEIKGEKVHDAAGKTVHYEYVMEELGEEGGMKQTPGKEGGREETPE